MRDIGNGNAEVIKKHRDYQRYIMILLFMSAMVAGLVVLVLMKPAVTMTYTCGFDYEHTHSIENGCFELICGMEEGDLEEDGVTPHVHSEDCYDLTHTICGLEEHVHTPDCLLKEDEEEDEVIEVTEAPTEPEATEAPAEETEEVTEETDAAPEVIEIRDISIGELYALDYKTEELTAQEAGELAADELAYDLSDDIEDLSYDEDSDIAEDSEKENAVQLTLKFKVPAEAFEDGNRIVYCTLPEEVSLGDKVTARKYMSEAYEDSPSYEICRYKLDPRNNMFIMEFSEEQIGDGYCNVSCAFRFDAIVSIEEDDVQEQTIKQGEAKVAVKAPDMRNVTIASDEPSFSISKSVIEESLDHYNGGYHDYVYVGDQKKIMRRIKFKIEFDVYNGTGGKDLVFRDKLDTFINESGDVANLIYFDDTTNDGGVYMAKIIRTDDNGTTEYGYMNYDWCDYYKINRLANNTSEFVIGADRFIKDTDSNTPYSHVNYVLEYYAGIDWNILSHYVEYGGSANNNASLSLGTAAVADRDWLPPGGNEAKEKYHVEFENNDESGAQVAFDGIDTVQNIYRGYTISQSASSFNSKTDKVTWSITLNRGYGSETGVSYQLNGDLNGLAVTEDTFKDADNITVSNGTESETYTADDNDKAFGTFDKANGKFIFKSGTTENTYTFTYENKADDDRTEMTSQPLFSRASDGRWIAESNEIKFTPSQKCADITFDDSKDDYDWKVSFVGIEGSFIVIGNQDSNEVTINCSAEQDDDDHYFVFDTESSLLESFTPIFKDKDGNAVSLTRGSRNASPSEGNDYYVEWYADKDAKTKLTDEEAIKNGIVKVRGVRIGLNNTALAATVCDMDVSYKTGRDTNYFLLSTVPTDTETTFTSSVGWQPYPNHWKSKSVTEAKKYRYIIYDNTGNAAGETVVYDDETEDPYYTSEITDNGTMILSWGIEGNYSAVYNKTGDVTFSVALPADTEFITEGTYAPTFVYYRDYVRSALSVDNVKDAESGVRYSVSGSTVTFTVPEEYRKNTSDEPVKFRIGYSVKLLSDIDPDGSSYICGVSDSTGFALTQKQNVEETVIGKTGVQGPDVVPANPIDNKTDGAYVKSHVITYTLDVNPQALTFNNGGKITVDDYMHYDLTKGYRPVLKSLEVKDMTNGGRVLSESEYTFTHRNTGLKASADERSDSANARYSGASIFLELDDSTYYQVTYVYHFKRNNSTDPLVTESSTLYNEARILVDDTEYGYTKFNKQFTFGIYEDDESDDYAVIEAVDSTNNNKKVSGCYFAFLRYNNDNYANQGWEIMTGATTDSDGRILATDWASYEEIKRGSTPEDIMTKYGMTEGSLPLLGPTDLNGRTRLPEIHYDGVKDYMYRVVEIKPNPNYTVNPDKIYGLGKDDFGMDGFPSNVFKDRVTSIYISPGGNYDKQTGVVIIPNEPRLRRDIELRKEWADSQSSHDDVSFNLFRSYEAKTATITKTINFTLKDKSGNSKTTSIKAPYLGSFYITIKGCQMFDQNSDYKFTVNGHTVTKNNWNDSQKDFAYYDGCTVRNRADDDEVIVYFTYPHSTVKSYDSSIGIENHSDGTDGDCAVWSNYVLKDMNIVLQAVTYDGDINSAVFVAPDFETEDYDTFNNIPEDEDRLKRKLDNGSEIYAISQLTDVNGSVKEEYLPTLNADVEVSVGEGNNWTYTWNDLPEKDCYGYTYFYYVEELPGGKNDSGRCNAELALNARYSSDYEIRYFNNGAFSGDTITVRNHEKAFIKTLPATGGEGRNFYIGIGLSIIGCAMLVLFSRKRSRGGVSP